MVHICYGCKKFEKSGKCRIRMKIRIPGKKFFWIFLFLNCEQFLLNKFFSKMVLYPKKVCFLHFSCAAACSSKPNGIYNLCTKSGQKIGKELDHLQVSPNKNSGKKLDPENPGKIWEKSGKNPDIKFLLFWVRYQEWILQMFVLWCNEIFFLWFTQIITFLRSQFLALYAQILKTSDKYDKY